MAIESHHFRTVLGHFATGVTIVTFVGPDGRPGGLTVNAFTSVSLEPPLVLVCIDHTTESYPEMTATGAFAINILAEDQRDLSSRFATKSIHVHQRFDGVAWKPGAALGTPFLDGCLGHLECRVRERHPGGDHTVFIGEVVDLAARDEGRPLLFYRGHYGEIAPDVPPVRSA